MTKLRYLSLVLVLLAAVLATGTGAFTAVSADRAMAVSVVQDDEALLGVSSSPIELDNGAHGSRSSGNASNSGTAGGQSAGATRDVTLLTLTNRFPERITNVSVRRVDDGASYSPPNIIANSLSADNSIESGRSMDVTARVVCSNANENVETWQFRIEVRTESASVETTETVTVECTGDPPAGHS